MKRFLLLLLMGMLCLMGVNGLATERLAETSRTVVVNGGGYFPVLIRLKTGELMAVLRGGAAHIGVKGRLDIVTSKDDGKTWSRPQTVVDSEGDDRNPAFGQLKNGELILAYAILKGYEADGLTLPRKTRVAEGVYLVRSRDKGKTWSKPELSHGMHDLQKEGGSVSPYGKIVQLEDGTALMSVYYQFSDSRGHEEYVFRSVDGGKTWGNPVLVGRHYNETGLLALRGGKVLAALRSETGGHLATAFSSDGGKTWTEPSQITADREHPGDLILLASGDVLLSYGERNKPFGVKAILSHDGGKSWSAASTRVLADDADSQDCGYPSSVQLADGRIVTIYYQVDDPKNTPASSKAKAVVWSLTR